IVEGPEYSGRETVYRNGSLHLQDVTQKDTGFYTLRSINRHKEIISTTSIYLHVYSFLWSCGPLSTSAQPTIESVPPIIPEGGSVLLLVHNLPENLRSLFWYKGMIVSNNFEVARHIITMNSSVLGPAHNGGETVYSNGSLLLHNVTWKDTGLYTLRTLSTDMKTELAHVQLQMDTSLSPCCNPLNSSQLMIQPIPQYAAEGESVLLQVHNLPEDLQAFSWYKSMHSALVLKIVEYSRAMNSTTWGSAHSRREAVYTNGSLMLQDVTEEDAGMYTLEILNRDFKIDKADVHLHVNKPVKHPFIQVTNTILTLHSSVVLTCLSAGTGISFRWIFNNQSLQLTERMTLSPTKCQLSIDPIMREDVGEYKCQVSNPVSTKTSLPVSLAVMNK
uniref:Carcinoembryonic antigen-related cell adhesion molecule 5-like n=1 Tax=Peromyscus maniculatus bairdii TaxID=230844 RepID=A0A8C8W372_PERMB